MQVVLMYCSCREQQHILRLPRSLDKLWSSTTLTLTFATEGTVGKWTTQLHGSQDSNTVFSLGFKQQSFVKLALIGCFIQLWSASWSWRKVATYTTVNCYTTVSKCTVNALASFFFFFSRVNEPCYSQLDSNPWGLSPYCEELEYKVPRYFSQEVIRQDKEQYKWLGFFSVSSITQ